MNDRVMDGMAFYHAGVGKDPPADRRALEDHV
jgi:hypothetical protein